MRSFKRVMCSFGGEEEYRRKVASSLPVSPQDDHVIEFAKQFGWDSTWLEKQQPKKRGKRQMAEQAASRASGDVGEMLASRAGSRETTSQVVPHDHDAAPFAPQVQAAPVAPPVQAAPLAPPSSSAVPIEAPALPATPAAHVMTPPPSRRRARSGSRDSGRSRLAVIARTAQSKAMPRPDSFVADIEAELEAEQSRGAQGEESREVSPKFNCCNMEYLLILRFKGPLRFSMFRTRLSRKLAWPCVFLNGLRDFSCRAPFWRPCTFACVPARFFQSVFVAPLQHGHSSRGGSACMFLPMDGQCF